VRQEAVGKARDGSGSGPTSLARSSLSGSSKACVSSITKDFNQVRSGFGMVNNGGLGMAADNLTDVGDIRAALAALTEEEVGLVSQAAVVGDGGWKLLVLW
jgi:hypothetical protein